MTINITSPGTSVSTIISSLLKKSYSKKSKNVYSNFAISYKSNFTVHQFTLSFPLPWTVLAKYQANCCNISLSFIHLFIKYFFIQFNRGACQGKVDMIQYLQSTYVCVCDFFLYYTQKPTACHEWEAYIFLNWDETIVSSEYYYYPKNLISNNDSEQWWRRTVNSGVFCL